MSDVESDGEDEGGRPWAPWEDELLMSAVEPYRTANINVNWADVVGRLHEGGSRRTVSKARNREIRIKKGPGRNNCKICGQKRRGHMCTGRPGPPKTPKVAMNAAASSGSVALPSTSGASARAAARPTTPTHHAWNGHRANLRDDVPQSPPAPPGSPANFGDAPLAAPTPAAAFSETPTAAAGRAPAPPRSSTSGGAARASSPAFNGPPAAPSAGTLVDGAATHVPPQKAPAPAKAAELDTVAEALMTSPVTVQDVMNRPSPPHEPFAEQARGAPIEDEFEQHWNATETSETHFFTDGTWLPKYI